ncbi:MAG: hypothetical protein WCE50_06255 [Candidatus Acidiferrum sp.]
MGKSLDLEARVVDGEVEFVCGQCKSKIDYPYSAEGDSKPKTKFEAVCSNSGFPLGSWDTEADREKDLAAFREDALQRYKRYKEWKKESPV